VTPSSLNLRSVIAASVADADVLGVIAFANLASNLAQASATGMAVTDASPAVAPATTTAAAAAEAGPAAASAAA
jgi:hypothetical protein